MKKSIKFSSHAWLDYIHWQKNDKSVKSIIDKYLLEIIETPYEGSGYPQPLSYDLSFVWCRRINFTHRLLYTVNDNEVQVIQCRFHF